MHPPERKVKETSGARTPATQSGIGMENLAADFIPGAFDVICSRGKAAYMHNKGFRATLEHHLPSYVNARSKQEKTEIVSMIYHGIQEATPDGGFIRKNQDGDWCRVPSHVAREKVGQGFRDLLHTEYRSSTKAKIKRRRELLYPPTEPPKERRKEETEAGNTAGSHPRNGSAKVSRSFSYDPLPLAQERQSEMNILSQCSFSFIASEEKTQALVDGKLERDESTPRGLSCEMERGRGNLYQGVYHQQNSSPDPSRDQTRVAAEVDHVYSPLSRVGNHPSFASTPEVTPPYPYQYQQHQHRVPQYHESWEMYQPGMGTMMRWEDRTFSQEGNNCIDKRGAGYHHRWF